MAPLPTVVLLICDTPICCALVLITSAMKENLHKSPSIIFLEGNHKINRENYWLHARDIQNRHENGWPVALPFLASEKAENIDYFFEAFEWCHRERRLIDHIFVDKDHNEIKGIEKSFSEAKVLFSVWHVLAYMQKKTTKPFGVSRGQVYKRFYDALYAQSEKDFLSAWHECVTSSSKKLHEYLRKNWLKCKIIWKLASRRTCRLIDNITKNSVES